MYGPSRQGAIEAKGLLDQDMMIRSPNSLVSSVKQFEDYFSDAIRKVEGLNDSLHTRILWVTLLDALSHAASPNLKRKNHDRIVRFLENFARWEHRDRVSLFQVKLNLEDKGLAKGDLHNEVERRLATWQPGNMYEAKHEPIYDDLITLAYCDRERAILLKCSYKNLFYTYRNHLIHDFRSPGHAHEAFVHNRKEAFYHSSSGEDGRAREWELVFPAALFQRLCKEGLNKLVEVLLAEERNPYVAYDFGSKW